MNKIANSFCPLDETCLRSNLASSGIEDDFDFHVFPEIGSTNQYLRDLPASERVSICVAETQSQGRGRFNRHWASPYGENIYLSSRWKLKPALPHSISSLSLVVGLGLVEALKPYTQGLPILVKWPNDLLFERQKLAGILIEILADRAGLFEVVIGIGLNVNTDTQKNPLAMTPCCSLYDMRAELFDRNRIIADILITLKTHLALFQKSGFQVFQKDWQAVDYLYGKWVQVAHFQKLERGFSKGVTDEGHLRLMDELGQELHLASGETSIVG